MTDMWYNMSQIGGNGDGVLSLVQSTNELFFQHLFGVLILVTLFIILFRAFVGYNNNPKVSLMYSCFFVAVLSILFRLVSLVNDDTVFITWGLFAIITALQFLID